MKALTFAKPEKRATTHRRKRRVESQVVQRVRALCVERDGDCRFMGQPPFVCSGASEWAHLGDQKRARTRGMAPESRHTTAGSLMLCSLHHQLYDRGVYQILALDGQGADGNLTVAWPDGSVHQETKYSGREAGPC